MKQTVKINIAPVKSKIETIIKANNEEIRKLENSLNDHLLYAKLLEEQLKQMLKD